MKVVSVERMRDIESAANEDGITFETMFERVGVTVAERLEVLLGNLHEREPRVTILVGGGNNGGDGLITALELAALEDVTVGVYLVKPRPADDPYLERLRNTDVFIAEAENDQQYRVLRNMVASANIVVDAIFGIGVRLPLEGEVTKILQSVSQALDATPPEPANGELIQSLGPFNRQPRPYMLALDCPSGVDCDTGEADRHTIPADETITFIAVKTGLLQAPAAATVGTLNVATLGIPATYTQADGTVFAGADLVRSLLPDHNDLAHKGTRGKVMIVAGSVNYTGAAGLAARAAYRAGSGLVTVAAPMPVIAALAATMPEPTWTLLAHDMGVVSEKAVSTIIEAIDTYNALLIGPGLGTEDTTGNMLEKLLRETQEISESARRPPKETRPIGFAGLRVGEASSTETDEPEPVQLPPLVLDADALNLLAKQDNWAANIPANTVITPHPGEMARLCQMETQAVQADRVGLAQAKAAEWGVIIVLKGAHTVVASPDGRTAVLPFKTISLATAGTGDILAGIIVSLLGSGLAPYDAALVGSYIHGCAGMLSAKTVGHPSSVLASDVVEQIASAFEMLAR